MPWMRRKKRKVEQEKGYTSQTGNHWCESAAYDKEAANFCKATSDYLFLCLLLFSPIHQQWLDHH